MYTPLFIGMLFLRGWGKLPIGGVACVPNISIHVDEGLVNGSMYLPKFDFECIRFKLNCTFIFNLDTLCFLLNVSIMLAQLFIQPIISDIRCQSCNNVSEQLLSGIISSI